MKKQGKASCMQEKTRKNFIIKVAIAIVALILILAIGISISEGVGKNLNQGKEEFTVDPSKLAETKEDGFDIMEYEDYLALDRTVIFYEKDTGASYSIDGTNYWGFGEDVKLVYEIIEATIAGNSDLYNELVHKDAGHYDKFTQQQIYDISITREERTNVNNDGDAYTEYVMKVEYKIHENNGSFRRDIESDASRPQYFVINSSTGKLLVMEIVPVRYAN
jgi:hypothetical protein